MKFTESQLEAAFIDLLEREGIVHVAGVGMARGPKHISGEMRVKPKVELEKS